jgi:hypothetical protein
MQLGTGFLICCVKANLRALMHEYSHLRYLAWQADHSREFNDNSPRIAARVRICVVRDSPSE